MPVTVKEYAVTITIGDNNTLYAIKNVTVYVYDNNAITGHGFTNGTYNEFGSYGFAWVNASGVASWKELAGGGWSDTLKQLDSPPKSSYPDLSQPSGQWFFEFNMTKVSRRTATEYGWKVQIYVYDGSDEKATDNTLHFGINFYHEETVVSAVTWNGATLGVANQTANTNPSLYTVTANAPFKIQITSYDAQLTGTHGQTPFNIGNVAIDNDNNVTDGCKIAHLSTSYKDFDNNTLGNSKTNGSYWFITIPSVLRDDTYTFNFASQVVMVDP